MDDELALRDGSGMAGVEVGSNNADVIAVAATTGDLICYHVALAFGDPVAPSL